MTAGARKYLSASTPPPRLPLGGVSDSSAPRLGRAEAASPSVPRPICSGDRSIGNSRESKRAPRGSAPPSLLAAEEEAEAGRSDRSLATHTLPWRAPERTWRYRAVSSLPPSVPSQLDSSPLQAFLQPDAIPLIIQARRHRARPLLVAQYHHAACVQPARASTKNLNELYGSGVPEFKRAAWKLR